MNMYEVLNLLFLGGTFLIALLAYIVSRFAQNVTELRAKRN